MGRVHATQRVSAVAVLVVLAGCNGTIGERDVNTSRAATEQTANGDPSGGGLPPAVAVIAPVPLRCTTKAVGPSPMRRLTHAEYDNSVAELVGDTTHPATDFPPDTQVGLFDNTAKAQTVPVLLADQYLDTAVTLAEGVKDLNALVGCDPAGTTGATCVRTFVQRFGRRAYRRPLTTAEVDDLIGIYTDTTALSDAPTGARGVIAAMLASPNFLFRPEFGDGASPLPKAKLAAPFELAARLSSLLWGSAPDDALLDAAASGKLQTAEQVQTAARRLLADPRARPAIATFYDQWFGLALLDSATKDAAIYPDFNDVLRNSMGEETRRFVSHVLWEDDARLATLLTASYSFINAPLAKLYGVSGPSNADTYVRTELNPQQRMGVLTQASLMTTFASPAGSSPIKRGKLVRVRLLCQDLPDPPANVPPPPAPKAGVSTRERFAMHTNSAACSGCHHLIDGLGFGLEHYDGVGAFRMVDQGVPVNSSGEVNTTEDIDGTYDGGPELATPLASSAQVRDCAPTQWLRYALARPATADDTCSLVQLRAAFDSSDGDLRELMVALTQTDAFLNYRQPE